MTRLGGLEEAAGRQQGLADKRCSGGKPISTITAGSPKQRLAKEHARGIETLAEKLLPVLDGFDLALAAPNDPRSRNTSKGVEIIRKQLWDVLAKQGIERIDALGKPFNPHLHHAIEAWKPANIRTAR